MVAADDDEVVADEDQDEFAGEADQGLKKLADICSYCCGSTAED